MRGRAQGAAERRSARTRRCVCEERTRQRRDRPRRCDSCRPPQGSVGWPTGVEPVTAGATIQCSTIELRPPCARVGRGPRVGHGSLPDSGSRPPRAGHLVTPSARPAMIRVCRPRWGRTRDDRSTPRRSAARPDRGGLGRRRHLHRDAGPGADAEREPHGFHSSDGRRAGRAPADPRRVRCRRRRPGDDRGRPHQPAGGWFRARHDRVGRRNCDPGGAARSPADRGHDRASQDRLPVLLLDATMCRGIRPGRHVGRRSVRRSSRRSLGYHRDGPVPWSVERRLRRSRPNHRPCGRDGCGHTRVREAVHGDERRPGPSHRDGSLPGVDRGFPPRRTKRAPGRRSIRGPGQAPSGGHAGRRNRLRGREHEGSPRGASARSTDPAPGHRGRRPAGHPLGLGRQRRLRPVRDVRRQRRLRPGDAAPAATGR